MMRFTLVVFILASVTARPSEDVEIKNVITVPPNCPPGQEYYNGACRDVWRSVDTHNVITVPPNCPPGQEWWNGACRDVWRSVDTHNVITVPPNCPPGQEWWNGACRDVWSYLKIRLAELEEAVKNPEAQLDREVSVNSIISVPNQCPNGYAPDALGFCRPILPS